MDSKGLSRSQYSSYESPLSTKKQAPQRKPHHKKHQNILSDGRVHGPGPGSNPDQGFPLFNNRSLSVLSTMHHLNPHRKVAMSPEILREAEEQASSLRKAVKQLHEQLEKTNREKARIHRFLSDLLYTLNARGYESVRDHEGTLVDLNKCKGETYLDLKGRDLKQRVSVRRLGGQELLMKAVIGNQERAIQSLVHKLDSMGRDIVLGNRLTMGDNTMVSAIGDSPRIASLEAEVLQLVNLIEGACQRCPDMYPALRDHYFLNEANEAGELSPRNPVLHNLLKKCEQISCEAQSKQLVDMLSSGMKIRSRTKPNDAASNSSSKSGKSKSSSKSKSGSTKSLRTVSSSDIDGNLPNPSLSRNIYESYIGQSSRECYDGHLKPLNGVSRSENTLLQKNPFLRFPTSSTPSPSSCSSTMISSNCGGEPTPTFLNSCKSTLDQVVKDCSVTVCPYCHRKFGIEESISEIKNHIEMHVFAGDATLP